VTSRAQRKKYFRFADVAGQRVDLEGLTGGGVRTGGTVLVARYVTGEGAGDIVEVAGADEGVVVEFEGVELGPLQEVVREGGEAVVVQVHLKERRFSRWGL
jgi:hypothetical protein